MNKQEMEKLYGVLDCTIEAFMAAEVEHETAHNVEVEGDTVEYTFYKVLMNPHEMITAAELTSIRNLLGEILEKNGVDLSAIKSGRTEEELAKADWTDMEIKHFA